ncbi:MAG: DUF3857 domain-containing protein [Bacteroidota bacterium]
MQRSTIYLFKGVMMLLGILTHFGSKAKDIKIGPVPSWVEQIKVSSSEIAEDPGGYQYLLLDQQDNLPSETRFRHFAVQIINSRGVQSLSTIDISYDPAYQDLTIHEITLMRDGKRINKLNRGDIEVLRREKNLERSLYDGSFSAVVNLSDVQAGDLLEYSYSIKGFNPINKGNYSTTFYTQFTVPVNRVFNRVLVSTSNDIQYKGFLDPPEPDISMTDALKVYTWDVNQATPINFDSNVPVWYDPQQRVMITTYDSWQEVVNWALPLYTYDLAQIGRIKSEIDKDGSIANKIDKYIRFVQDDVRYLGLEYGISAYKPHAPAQVFEQKFGDCKDKSLLLVSLLRSENIQAFPVLVNTNASEVVNEFLPGATAFNHCVVNFEHDGEQYFVDPTISNQGGTFKELYFPDYKSGLIIKEGKADLTTIASSPATTLDIYELITVESIGGPAEMVVRSEYTGSKADYIRQRFAGDTKENISKNYLNYYSNLYPSIELAKPIKFLDYERNTTNRVITEEYYRIPNFWLDSDDSTYVYCETYPLVLDSEVDYAKTAARNMPYYVSSPHVFKQTTELDMPEEWTGDDYHIQISGDGYDYINDISTKGKTVTIVHKYEVTRQFIEADEAEMFLADHDKIKKEFSYYLKWSGSDVNEAAGISWFAILVTLLTLATGAFYALKLYKGYDPEPWEFAEDKPIGSWLIFPAIGLTVSPLALLYSTLSEGHFEQSSWSYLLGDDWMANLPLAILLTAELIINWIYFILSVVLLISFYQRRTNVPRLATLFYAGGLVLPVLDQVAAELLIPDLVDDVMRQEAYRTVVRAFIGAAIWIPVFNISERVKSTFCKQLQPAKLENSSTDAVLQS